MPLEERMKLLEELQYRTCTHACPSCGKPSYCAMEAGKSINACWCIGVEVQWGQPSPPSEVMGDSCLCKECIGREYSG